MNGYAGKVLYIDLTTGKTRTEKLDEDYAKKYIGGIGLGMRLWLANSKAGVDALSPENPIVLALGPVSGTMFPTGGNGHAFISKSPETGAVGEAVSHGTFGAELKRAGYDAVVITGKAERQERRRRMSGYEAWPVRMKESTGSFFPSWEKRSFSLHAHCPHAAGIDQWSSDSGIEWTPGGGYWIGGLRPPLWF